MKVLIADDEEELLETLASYFKLNNIDTDTAKDGKEAYEMCIRSLPDFLILDLNMGRYDGFYALDRLIHEKKSPKVIIYTGNVDSNIHNRLSCFKCKIVHKPVKPSELIKIIQNF